MRVAVLLVLAACDGFAPGHGEAQPDADLAHPGDARSAGDAPTDTGPPPSELPAMLTVPATHGTIANTFSAAITGRGTSAGLGEVSIGGNTGSITLGTEASRIALYNSVPFGSYNIFGSIAVAPDRWTIAYPYCQNGSLVDVYAETVGGGGFQLRPATGSCSSQTRSTPTAVDLPGFTIATPTPYGSATVHGPKLDLDHGIGDIEQNGTRLPAVVFDTVDCSTACGAPGWYELHTLIWDDANQAATFVIIYLRLGMTDRVQLSYALRLPALDDPFHDVVLEASWTGTAARTLDGAEPVHLPPPWQR